ncbi:MAG TPA: M28 family peptidase [Myxococcales bacterium]|nr:M28 family peptidase [Myxococcales bacterium]
MDELRTHVEQLARTPRPPGTEAHAQALTYLEQVFRQQGWQPRRVPFSGEADGVNLFAETGPADGPLIVMGAHYDSVPDSPGADDNASGVAALLGLSKMFVGESRAHLLFAAYDREEDGLLGSRAHCATLRAAGQRVAAMISLEMLGFTSAEQTVPPGVQVQRDKGDFLALVANEASAHLLQHGGKDPFVERAVVQANSTAALMARLSDHGAFWEAGFPALLATDTAFLRNPHYHRESDTPDKLDYPFLRRSTGAVAHWLRSLLEAL